MARKPSFLEKKLDFYFVSLDIPLPLQDIVFAAILLIAVFLSVITGKLTFLAGITGGIIAICVYMGANFTGVAMLGAFFLAGTLATSLGVRTKQALHVAEHNKGRRTAGQVIANGGVAGFAGITGYCLPEHKAVMILMMAAALSSAAADTLSSELGTVYGKRSYNIITFRKDIRGENGVVSLEGTLFGVAGSLLIALVYALGLGLNIYCLVIVIAGTIGNITDSLLGAALERRGYIGNNAVNLLNTLVAAVVAYLISCVL